MLISSLVPSGSDRVRYRSLRRVVRGVHGKLRTRAAPAPPARLRAAQPQDAGSLASGTHNHYSQCTVLQAQVQVEDSVLFLREVVVFKEVSLLYFSLPLNNVK